MKLEPRDEIALRCFLVGCPRSGTTLVQAMLAAHPELASFPETNYINTAIGDFPRRVLGRPHETAWSALRTGLRLRLHVANRGAVRQFARTMQGLGAPELRAAMRRGPVSIRRAIRTLVGALDHIALDTERLRWVEKSPTHYAYLDYIERYCPDARYLHVVRRGSDVVASLHDAAQRLPGTFWEHFFADVDDCIRCWNGAVRVTASRAHHPDHYVLRYEDVLADPQKELESVCDWLGIEFHASMATDYSAQADRLRVAAETWKDGVAGPLQSTSKFERLFSPGEQRRILDALDRVDGVTPPETDTVR